MKEPSKSAAKRVKNAKFVYPNIVGQDDDSSVIVDVSNMAYTLSQCYMLGDNPVLEDINFSNLANSPIDNST